MNGELSRGLPELTTSGNRILRSDTMSSVLLCGINRSGLEYSEPSSNGFLAAAELNQAEISEIVKEWHSNIIRLPFNQDWCLAGRGGHSAEEYLASLDQVISWASELGAYTILDLQWLDSDTAYGTTDDGKGARAINHVAPAPDEKTIILWRKLAARYKDEPALIFDLFNEPHDRLIDDPNPIHIIDADGQVVTSDSRRLGADAWVRWANLLIHEIRSQRPNGIVLVGGIDWAFDLSDVRVDAPNIVYGAHIYPNRKQREWRKAIGAWRDVPIFVSEWGGGDWDLEFGRSLTAEMRERGLGWTAWSWADYPHLVVPPRAPNYEPTQFGVLVRDELANLLG